MPHLNYELTLVDGAAYSQCRLKLRVAPDVTVFVTLAEQTVACVHDLVDALNTAFAAVINGGQVSLTDASRVRFSALTPFAFDLELDDEGRARHVPLLALCGFDCNASYEMSFAHTGTLTPEQMFSATSLQCTEPEESHVYVHHASGGHGRAQTVAFGAWRSANVTAEFLSDRERAEFERWYGEAKQRPRWMYVDGETCFGLQPLPATLRGTAGVVQRQGALLPYWALRLPCRREVVG